jgi:histidine ammonia-lyase
MQPITDPLSTREKLIELSGEGLQVEDVVAVARSGARVRVSDEALQRVHEARGVVERVLAKGTPVYGMNTGLGSLSRHHVALEELERFSFATVADQTASYGQPLATDIVRAMMVARANGMAKAGVGVRR